ncbi:MAG: hypothetical protein AAF911_14360 [Planctomycetota bacterium]
MYCRNCLYPLAQLEASACPECGRRFDRQDPRTFLKRPRKIRGFCVHVILGALGGVAAAGAVVLLLFLDFEPAGWLAIVGLMVGGMLYDQTPHFVLYGFLAHFTCYLALGMLVGGITWVVRRLKTPYV